MKHLFWATLMAWIISTAQVEASTIKPAGYWPMDSIQLSVAVLPIHEKKLTKSIHDEPNRDTESINHWLELARAGVVGFVALAPQLILGYPY